jgi:limonene-1,2-epoxide hydrolase
MPTQANDDPIEIATSFLQAWADGDMDAASRLLGDDVQFEGPMQTARGRDEVAAAMGDFGKLVSGITLIATAGDAERVLVMCDMHTQPFGTLRAAEHYVIRDGRIISVPPGTWARLHAAVCRTGSRAG